MRLFPAALVGLVVALALGGCDDGAGEGDEGVPLDGGVAAPMPLYYDGGPALACGACSVACVELVTEQAEPGFYLLAADANGLVWSTGLGPAALWTRQTGANAPRLLAEADAIDGALADATSVYWLDGVAVGGAPARDRILKVARVGGAPSQVGLVGRADLGALFAADDNNLYFVDASGGGRGLFRIAKSGGATTPLVAGYDFTALLVDGSNLVFADLNAGAAHLWSTPAMTIGGVATQLGPIGFTHALGADAQNFYFTDGALRRLPRGGAGSAIAIAESASGPFVVAGGKIYFLVEHGVASVAVTGGLVTSMCSGRITPWNLALGSDGSLFVADRGSEAILQLTP